MRSLEGIKIVSLCINLPGPAAAFQLQQMGAHITKVEPPGGDPLFHALPDFYKYLNQNQDIVEFNLKESAERQKLDVLLHDADVLLASSRIEALKRLNLDWDSLKNKFPRLCYVAIVGDGAESTPGHDLTYQAHAGLLSPPIMPSTCIADMAGAQNAVNSCLSLLLLRQRKNSSVFATVALNEAADFFALPLQFGLCGINKILGGAKPTYNLYPSKNGWIALAALEPHFEEKLKAAFRIHELNYEALKNIFITKTSSEWEIWAVSLDLPIAEVRSIHHGTKK